MLQKTKQTNRTGTQIKYRAIQYTIEISTHTSTTYGLVWVEYCIQLCCKDIATKLYAI